MLNLKRSVVSFGVSESKKDVGNYARHETGDGFSDI